MNLALFVTRYNFSAMSKLIEEMTKRQTVPVNGVLVVIHTMGVNPNEINQSVGQLASMFKKGSSLRVQANSSRPNEAQLGALFAKFISQAYTTSPGPWLICDDGSHPKVDDFMGAAAAQHAKYGGMMTGRGEMQGTNLRPVGPVTLDIPVPKIRYMRYSTHEHWRDRGLNAWNGNGFQSVPIDEYLFVMEGAKQAASPAEEPTTEDVDEEEGPDPIDEPSVRKYELMTDTELRMLVERRTGKAPHHSCKTASLILKALESETNPQS